METEERERAQDCQQDGTDLDRGLGVKVIESMLYVQCTLYTANDSKKDS